MSSTVPSAFSDHYDYYTSWWNLLYRGRWQRSASISNPREGIGCRCHHPPPQCQTRPRTGGNVLLSDEHDCLLFTGHFSGESSTLIMETSSSRSPTLSRVITLLITKAITRNPSEATTSYAVLINAPRTNGSSSQATFVLLVPISVLRWPDPRFIHL